MLLHGSNDQTKDVVVLNFSLEKFCFLFMACVKGKFFVRGNVEP